MTKPDDPAHKVARDLTEIRILMDLLRAQAEQSANTDDSNGLHLPDVGLPLIGGGGVSSPAAWQRRYDYNAAWNADHPDKPRDLRYIDVEKEVDPPPLQLLLQWSEPYRKAHGTELGQRRPTLGTEAAFLTWCLPTIRTEHADDWEAVKDDINRARTRLEDVLHAGTRQERTRVVCDHDHCTPKPPRLIVIRVADVTGDSDFYKCPRCKHRFNDKDFDAANRAMLRSQGAAKYVTLRDAVSVLKIHKRGERTIRRWMEPTIHHHTDRCTVCKRKWPPREHAACPGITDDGDVCGGELHAIWTGDPNAVIESYCDIATHTTHVWWPDIWTRHLTTRRTRRTVA